MAQIREAVCVCVLSCLARELFHPKSGEPAHIYKRAHNIQTETPPGNAPHRAAPGNRPLSRRQITAGPPSNSAIPSGASPPRCSPSALCTPPCPATVERAAGPFVYYTVLYYTAHDDTPAPRCGVFWAQARGPGGEHGGEARGERREGTGRRTEGPTAPRTMVVMGRVCVRDSAVLCGRIVGVVCRIRWGCVYL